VDSDTCDDCSVLGQADVSDDGSDKDSDDLCNAGDPDDNNDTVPDGEDNDDDNDGWKDDEEVLDGGGAGVGDTIGSNPVGTNSTLEVCGGVDNDLSRGTDEGFPDTNSDSEAVCIQRK
jgi:hypothetical protein